MNIAERLKQDSFQQGIHAGIEQGMHQGKLEGEHEAKITVAKNLLLEGIKVEVVKSATGLADEIIAKLTKIYKL